MFTKLSKMCMYFTRKNLIFAVYYKNETMRTKMCVCNKIFIIALLAKMKKLETI